MTKATLTEPSISLGLAYSFRGRKHGKIQADMVLEKELRVLHLDLQTSYGDCVPHWAELEHKTLKPTSTVTHFFQLGQTLFNKFTTSNIATFYGLSIQIHDSVRAIPI